MAHKVEAFPVNPRRRCDWENWLDGNCWKFEQGVDFLVSPLSFAAQAHIRVSGRPGTMQTRIAREKNANGEEVRYVYLQYFPTKKKRERSPV